MKIVRRLGELREEVRRARARGAERVGIVPTMGALHDGHLSLVRAARRDGDVVVMSIFVNPKQFTETADLAGYPRQEAADAVLAESAGVDVLFAPDAAELYPDGFATTVHVGGPLTQTLEASGRGPEHFDGVATVVAKLLLVSDADAAYFGQKDAQQVMVVRRMVADLGIPTRIVACPTVRDRDGLALSSRNVRLSAEERSRATAIPRALEAVEAALALGETSVEALHARAAAVLTAAGIPPEYVAFVDERTVRPVSEIADPVLCAIAARVGSVRLIDNALLTLPDPTEEH
ncbi:pantoate--beta-alanine ligase [Leucobacter chromiiresistens]|uniref:Pantothenate synthetase n=1 Tax=Leucobacter chromiiresistens TaxID=1079994 RepID=A0A1H0YR02_9MICO|nr:pantoate--beta-alanine ligase [Leucobacter chromiiresistens]SDQ17647.1 pantoate--beta-alanine ligase [Leucobacter chromiiresistens]